MLGILKVNAGISTDGTSEFTLTVVDVNEHVYEVQIDDVAYAQIVGVIEDSTGYLPEEAPEPSPPTMEVATPEVNSNGNGAEKLSPEKKAALANILSGTPQHVIEGDEPKASLADVGYDIDYTAEMGEYADEDEDEDEEMDPGEMVDDDYAEPL